MVTSESYWHGGHKMYCCHWQTELFLEDFIQDLEEFITFKSFETFLPFSPKYTNYQKLTLVKGPPTAQTLLTFDSPELFWNETLDGLVALDDEAEGGELTAAVADHVVCQCLGKDALQPQSLEPGECSTCQQLHSLHYTFHFTMERQLSLLCYYFSDWMIYVCGYILI